MNDPVRVDKASLDALTEAWREACVERDALRRENAELKKANAQFMARLTKYHTSLAEQFNDPMQDGGKA